ncbi:hypothetical protein PR202_ga03374 [Eleusine coracana subsp. coracana]|uniref:Uncharacterized protein n=1 Tax=Eleusine coracana subsp. coracana TaxID=191504 RepID=A0AAV5BPA3_ELECO|nr:hypothetical protein PR202_ga03374 [Eleusine coracana subsp. coracana]
MRAPLLRRWMRSGHPAAHHCPVCKAAVSSEDRLVKLYLLYGRRHHQPPPPPPPPPRCCCKYKYRALQYSNAGLLIAIALLPLQQPRPVIFCNGRQHKKVEHSLHQLWLFLAVAALLCFLF